MTMVKMTHPDIPDGEPATTTDEAFRKVWEPRGWELADEAAMAAADVLGAPVPNLDGLTKPQLLEVAANLGVEGVTGRTSKDGLVEAIRDHQAATAATEEG